MSSETLKPCPFCGSPAKLSITKRENATVYCSQKYYEGCPGRKCFGLASKDIVKEVEMWNRRAKS